MLNVESAMALAVFLFAMSFAILKTSGYRAVRISAAVLIGSCLLGGWAAIATCFNRPVVGVTYHAISQQKLPDGSVIDIVAFKDEAGQSHVVNINQSLGLAVPRDGRFYQIARVKYSSSVLGLRFNRSEHKYKIIPVD